MVLHERPDSSTDSGAKQQASSTGITGITDITDTGATFTPSEVLDELISEFEGKFEDKFSKIFKLAHRNMPIAETDDETGDKTGRVNSEFSAEEVEVARQAVSNILGGVGRFNGIPETADSNDVDGGDALLNSNANRPIPTVSTSKAHAGSISSSMSGNKNPGNQKPGTSSTAGSTVFRAKKPDPISLVSATPSRTMFPRGECVCMYVCM